MSSTKKPDFNRLVKEYGERVYNIALRITGNQFDAEDATQETFFRIHRSLHTFRGDSSIYSWIYRIAVNTALRLRGRLEQSFFDSIDEASELFGAEIPDDVQRWSRSPEDRYLYDTLLGEIQKACLHLVTCRLTDEQRTVYVLRGMLDFSLDETAAILDIDKNVVKARLHRAKRSLKEYFSGRCQWATGGGDCTCESKLGFALSSAPEIIQKLRNLPPDREMEKVISRTLSDVTDLGQVGRVFSDEPVRAELLEKLLV